MLHSPPMFNVMIQDHPKAVNIDFGSDPSVQRILKYPQCQRLFVSDLECLHSRASIDLAWRSWAPVKHFNEKPEQQATSRNLTSSRLATMDALRPFLWRGGCIWLWRVYTPLAFPWRQGHKDWTHCSTGIMEIIVGVTINMATVLPAKKKDMATVRGTLTTQFLVRTSLASFFCRRGLILVI